MTPQTAILAGGGLLVVLLGAAVAVEGKLLLNAHEKLGDLKADNAAKAKVIEQNEKDAVLGLKLANLETQVNSALSAVVAPVRERIISVPSNKVCPGDDAGAAAAAGVVQLRAEYGAGKAQPARVGNAAVRAAPGQPATSP